MLDECTSLWRELPHAARSRIHLAASARNVLRRTTAASGVIPRTRPRRALISSPSTSRPRQSAEDPSSLMSLTATASARARKPSRPSSSRKLVRTRPPEGSRSNWAVTMRLRRTTATRPMKRNGSTAILCVRRTKRGCRDRAAAARCLHGKEGSTVRVRQGALKKGQQMALFRDAAKRPQSLGLQGRAVTRG